MYVFVLRQEKVICGWNDFHAEEKMKRPMSLREKATPN
jgi:hypothetical protein